MKKTVNYIKPLSAIIVLFLFSLSAFAQNAPTEAKQMDKLTIPQIFFDPLTYLMILMAAIILLTIFAMSRTITVLTRVIEGRDPSKIEEEEEFAKVSVHKDSMYKRIMKALVRSVPVENEKDVMLDHDYDGIHELNNQLPPWWKYGFYFTIVFAFIYLINFHVSGSGKLQLAEYKQEMETANLEAKARMENNKNNVNASTVLALTDPAEISAGKDIFMKSCKACHGDFGQGVVGPNLTDEYWIHGGGIKNIFNTITEGFPAKGMISWKSQLTPKSIQEVASYILTLKGTNPAGAKEPQGDKWIDETPASTKADSLAVDSTKSMASSK